MRKKTVILSYEWRLLIKNILLVLILTACSGGKMRQELQRVDSLNQSECLLDTITTMQEVADYFDTWGSADERMTAHYLLGRVFQDQNNSPMALRCFRDAVSYADTTAADCDFRRLSRIYGQMADLFHRQRAPRLEIDAERKAVEYAWRAKDTLAACLFYGYLAPPYQMLNDLDSALYYSIGACDLLRKYHREDIAAGMNGVIISIYLRRGELRQAKQEMDLFEHYYGEEYIVQGRMHYYNYKGHYYQGIGKTDSAEYYYRKALSRHPSFNTAEAAYRGLLSLYQQLGNGDSISKYANLYCETNDSASFAHSADEIVRTQALYSYEEHERIAQQKEEEATYYRNAIFLAVIAFLLLAYLTYRYIKSIQQRRKEELMTANEEYSSLLLQYSQLQKDLTLSEQDRSLYRQAKEKEIQELIRKLSFYQDAPQITEHWNIEQAMLSNPIVTELHHLASHVVKPSDVQWKELREFMERELPDFYQKINSKNIFLSPQEILACILIRLQFSQGELSALFGVSKQRINNIKRNINKKMFYDEGAQTLNNHITNL